MSALMAAFSGLRKEIAEKLGLVREFKFTAGEDINIGSKIAIGSDGKAYTKETFDEFNILEEVDFLRKDNNTTYIAGCDSLENGNSLTLVNNYGYNNSVSNEWTLDLIYTYYEDGDLKSKLTNVAYAEGYQYSDGDNYKYQGLQSPILHKIDSTHYLVAWFYNEYKRSGGSYYYDNRVRARIITIDDTSISLSGVTELQYYTDSSTTGYAYPSYKFLPFDAKNIFAYLRIGKDLLKITIADDYSISIQKINDDVNYSNYIYEAVVPLTNENGDKAVMAIPYFNTTNKKLLINSADNTDFTQVDKSDDEQFSSSNRSWVIDFNKIIVYDKGNLYLLEYNIDATLKTRSTINCNFDVGLFVFIQTSSQDFFAYKQDNKYILAVTIPQVSGEIYEDSSSNSIRKNNDVIIITITQDGDNYVASLIGKIPDMSYSTTIRPALTKVQDTFVVVSGGWRDYDSTYDIVKNVAIKTSDLIAKKVELYAKNSASTGEEVVCFTSDVPINLDISLGEFKNGFVGIAENKALKESK